MSLELGESLGFKLKIWDMIYFRRNSKTIINRALLLLQAKPYAIVERKPRIFPVSLNVSLIFLLLVFSLLSLPKWSSKCSFLLTVIVSACFVYSCKEKIGNIVRQKVQLKMGGGNISFEAGYKTCCMTFVVLKWTEGTNSFSLVPCFM